MNIATYAASDANARRQSAMDRMAQFTMDILDVLPELGMDTTIQLAADVLVHADVSCAVVQDLVRRLTSRVCASKEDTDQLVSIIRRGVPGSLNVRDRRCFIANTLNTVALQPVFCAQ